MILKLRAKPLQFQAAPNTPGPHGILPYNLQRPPHSGQEVGRKTPIILPTVITQALHVYAPHLYDPRFPNPSNQVSAVVRTQGHHPASPNPSSSQFPMSSRAPVSQVSSALIVSPGSLQQDPNDPTYYHQQDIGSVGDFFFYNPTYPISFRSQGAPDSVGPAASRPLDVSRSLGAHVRRTKNSSWPSPASLMDLSDHEGPKRKLRRTRR